MYRGLEASGPSMLLIAKAWSVQLEVTAAGWAAVGAFKLPQASTAELLAHWPQVRLVYTIEPAECQSRLHVARVPHHRAEFNPMIERRIKNGSTGLLN